MFFSVDFHHKLYNATICSWEGLWQCRHAEIVWRWRRTFEQRKHNFSDVFYLCRFIFFLFLCIWTILWCRPFEQTKHYFSDVFNLCRFLNFSFSAYGATPLGKQKIIYQMFFICADFISVSLHVWCCPFEQAKYYFQIVWRWNLPVSDFVHKQSIILPF